MDWSRDAPCSGFRRSARCSRRRASGRFAGGAAAAAGMQAIFGQLDVPFGEVARPQRGSVVLPANGFPGDPCGVFQALYFDTGTVATQKRVRAIGGDSFVAAVEFAEPVRAMVLNACGNASQPGSPRFGDQLTLSANGDLRPAWRTQPEIVGNLEAREVVGGGTAAIATPVS